MATHHLSAQDDGLWILKKAVTTLAIAPQTESLTRVGRLAYNVMLKLAQDMRADDDGGFSAPLSEIVKGFGATTRDSERVREYIEQMCATVVRWFPLAASDAPLMAPAGFQQSTLAGIEPPPVDDFSARIFTLLAEARLYKRGGERWVTWYFPPTIREMLLEPARFAQLNIRELALLSHYAGVALAEICSRYLDSPGGLTNRADPSWWMTMLRSGPDVKPRDWRRWKSESLKPAIAEINQRMSMDVELIEFKQGRAVTGVQFAVRRKSPATRGVVLPADGSLSLRGEALGIRERDVDSLVFAHGEAAVEQCLAAMESRLLSKPNEPIPHRLAYLKKTLRNATEGSLFEERKTKPIQAPSLDPRPPAAIVLVPVDNPWLDRRLVEISNEMELLTSEELDAYATRAERALISSGQANPSLIKRFKAKQYRSPLIWRLIRVEYAREKYGEGWDRPPAAV